MKKAHSTILTVLMYFLLFNISDASSASWVNISGMVTYNNTPVCAMVLANGQYMFTPSGNGIFNFDVPLDNNGQITVFTFCSGFSPFKKVIYPSEGKGMNISLNKDYQDQGMDVFYNIKAVNENRIQLSGNVYFNGNPVCAMVLSNGQYMFSSSANGSFSLNLPLDDNDGATLFSFCNGLPPFKEVITASSISFFEDSDGDGYTIYHGDCNDLDASINPQAMEICGDGIDQDCDGSDTVCQGGGSLTIAGESGNQVYLNDTWASGCIADIEDGESETSVLTISGATFSMVENIWVDSLACYGPADITVTINGSFVLGNEVSVPMNSSIVTATKMDIVMNSYKGTINNSDLVPYFNAENECGFNNWKVNTPKDLIGSSCRPDQNSKDLLYIDDTVYPDAFYFGDDDEAPVDANGYPTSIDRDTLMERM